MHPLIHLAEPEMRVLPKWLSPIKSRFGAYSILLFISALVADYLTGPHIRLPIVSVIPIVLTGWLAHSRMSLLIAIAAPALRLLADVTVWHTDTSIPHAVINALTYMGVFSVLSILANRAGAARRLKERVRTLEGILPICAFCKRIRDIDDEWHPLESYISQRSEAMFSHGFCPNCARQHYGEYFSD